MLLFHLSILQIDKLHRLKPMCPKGIESVWYNALYRIYFLDTLVKANKENKEKIM